MLLLIAISLKKFDVDEAKESITEESIITIYKTDIETRESCCQGLGLMLRKASINWLYNHVVDTHKQGCYMMGTISYCNEYHRFLQNQFRRWFVETVRFEEDDGIIPPPGNEPIVGVIDTPVPMKRCIFINGLITGLYLPEDILRARGL